MYVHNPKNHYRIFLDNSKVDYQDRLKEVMDKVLSSEDIVSYCESNAIIKNNRQELSHVAAERILENCATYLLLGQYKENGIQTLFNIRRAQVNELPASILDGNAEDLMYATNKYNKSDDVSASNDITYNEESRNELFLSNRELNKKNKRIQRKVNKYRNSKAYRLEMLHSTKPVHTYKIKQQFYKDEKGNLIKVDGKKQPIKNVFGQPVFDAEYMIIGGRNGIIDEQNLYKTSWSIVDINNEFWYNTYKFKIDKDFEPYRVREDNKCDMDKIMIVPVDDGLVFYDQSVNRIPNNVVNLIN